MARKAIDCPACGERLFYERVADIPSFPFCSRRCRLVDLDKWLEEEYRVSRDAGEDPGDAPGDFNSAFGREKS